MSTIFARTQQVFSKKSFNQHFLIPRRWESGTQHLGYVNYFNKERLFGFIVREDAPEQMYHFSGDDLTVETIPHVRKYQQVAFQAVIRQDNHYAKDITSPDGEPLVYSYKNLRLNMLAKTKQLSSTEQAETSRFRGIVRRLTGGGGFITPIEIGYKDAYFDFSELQTTGKERISEDSEVEFSVRERKNTVIDKAINITRPGGGLITEDSREIGQTRRLLGAMYKESDVDARIPSEFANGKNERREGYIAQFNPIHLHGYIMPFDNPEERIFVSIDDCHIYGKRSLRRFQHVEFYTSTTSSGDSRAFHVCGPGGSVLRFTSPNHYTPKEIATREFEPDSGFHKGHVCFAPRDKAYFLIKPDERGYSSVLAFHRNASKLGLARVSLGANVEFTVVENTDKKENAASQKAGIITAGGGRPFFSTRGSYGSYLAQRFNFAKPQSELPECPLKEGQKFNGWISSFSFENKTGTIEIEAPPNQRYRKVVVNAKDLVLGDQILSEESLLKNFEVTVELRQHTPKETEGEEKAHVLTQEAFNVVSRNLPILRIGVGREREKQFQKQEKRL